MEKKSGFYSVFFWGWGIALLFGLSLDGACASAGESGAGREVTAKTFVLKTEYPSVEDSTPMDGRVYAYWEVLLEKTGDAAVTRHFFRKRGRDVSRDASSICTVITSVTDEGRQICFHTASRSDVCDREGGIIIVPGFPAPCDILPDKPDRHEKDYVNRSQAGGRIFEWRYRVEQHAIEATAALAAGYVDSSIDLPATAGMVMIQAMDTGGKILARQLWCDQFEWWIYEETPERRSWLLSEQNGFQE